MSWMASPSRCGAGAPFVWSGESGCGKSVTALSIMGLLAPTAHVGRGEILLDGTDILKLDRKALNERRGDRMAMIFQEPMTSLNPVFTIGDQIIEGILRHRQVSRADAHAPRGRDAEEGAHSRRPSSA